MFGIEKYLIYFNICIHLFLSLVLGVYLYDSNAKQTELLNQNFAQIQTNQKTLIEFNEIISKNHKDLESDLVALQTNLKLLQNSLSTNQTTVLKTNDDFNSKINEINNAMNAINDKFKRMPKPVFCQYLN